MPFHALKETDKHAFMTRLAERCRAANMAQHAKKLVVDKGSHVKLSARTAKDHQMEIRRSGSADELSKWAYRIPAAATS